MYSSYIEYSESKPKIKIGYGTKFNSASITIRNGGELEIGDLCELRGRIIIESNCKLTIGNGLICNDMIFIHVAENGAISIGDDCLFANCRIYNSDMHGIFDRQTGKRINRSKDVVIEDKVWLARDTIILKGARINKGCVVGAGTLVNGSFIDFSMIAGSPAKIIKTGIVWTRNITETLPALIHPDFSLSKFCSLAMQFKHDEVISIGISLWSKRQKISESDYYIIYYLARAILLKHFTQPNIDTIKISNTDITLVEVYETLYDCFEKSKRKNWPCGCYARLAAKYAGNTKQADHLYNIIKPFFPSIDESLFN
ncbi:acyltransferase [Gilliamella sp. B2776]|uniref:acyltransferase n=1 Tax=unclassified Gilliamella TaxID=2685620 RepID=UPI002269FCFB|nr:MULTISPECIES: acyltransferase [unclassified Gilliamella]MCX8649486.1 acyltransferase [Gilliamella sp. B2779]MCX8654530.1 acyltransferase [Gilliamella sp. B2737]MCX8656402.1 acyltransferase [Gilliamella sp. B2894]MCX8664920.1 acyltransferase [Gilliamella sp. B2887]MCX8692205.1 acyltransferase [Gilliamella sp. B2776]